MRWCGGCPAHLTRVRMLLDTVLCFDALTFVLGLLCAQCLRAMGRIKRGAVGMPKRKKMKRETLLKVVRRSRPRRRRQWKKQLPSLRCWSSAGLDERCHGHWLGAGPAK